MRIVVVVALASGLISSLPALADGEACTLKKGLKVSIGGKWETLPAGEALTVTTHAAQWSTIDTKKGPAKASTTLLEAACGLAAGTDKPAKPTKADKPVKKAETTPAEPAAVVVAVAEAPVLAAAAVHLRLKHKVACAKHHHQNKTRCIFCDHQAAKRKKVRGWPSCAPAR